MPGGQTPLPEKLIADRPWVGNRKPVSCRQDFDSWFAIPGRQGDKPAFPSALFPELVQGRNTFAGGGMAAKHFGDGGGGFTFRLKLEKISQTARVNVGRHQVMPSDGVRLAFRVPRIILID